MGIYKDSLKKTKKIKRWSDLVLPKKRGVWHGKQGVPSNYFLS